MADDILAFSSHPITGWLHHASRAQAARTLAEMNQLLGKHQREAMVDTGPIKELSRAAMLEELKQLQS